GPGRRPGQGAGGLAQGREGPGAGGAGPAPAQTAGRALGVRGQVLASGRAGVGPLVGAGAGDGAPAGGAAAVHGRGGVEHAGPGGGRGTGGPGRVNRPRMETLEATPYRPGDVHV